jgi:PIN domain nuclease of toxin-antitoxin system
MTVYLDTHILLWLYTNKLSNLSKDALRLIENNDLITGEINILELEYMNEIGRTNDRGLDVYRFLNSSFNLKSVGVSSEVIFKAMNIGWTRDLFDRLTVAGTMVFGTKLLTKDAHILDNFDLAVW